MTNTPTISMRLIRACVESKNYEALFSGVDTDVPARDLIAQIVPYTQDQQLIHDIVKSALPPNYSGNTLKQIKKKIAGAVKKGFHLRVTEKKSENKPRETQANVMIEYVLALPTISFFHDATKTAYISIKEPGKGQINYVLSSRSAGQWLRHLFFRAYNRGVTGNILMEVCEQLDATALFASPELAIHQRVGRNGETVVINLANQDGEMVVIDKDGYRLTKDADLMFVTSPGMEPLPHPVEGDGTALRRFQKLLGITDAVYHRVLAFMLNCLKPEGSYNCLLVEGEQGSGKSMLCELIKRTIDPAETFKERLPDSPSDVLLLAKESHLTLFDNVSGFRKDISDTLCGISTGTSSRKRKLYTDTDMHTIKVCRPFIINGIDAIAKRPDLLERSISIKLRSMPAGSRNDEDEVRAAFFELRPYILHELYQAVACSLRNLATTAKPTELRMITAARWVIAGETAFDLEPGTMLKALTASQSDVMTARMEDDPLAVALYKVASNYPFEGTMGSLYLNLQKEMPPYDRTLPKTAAHLSTALVSFRVPLEKSGVMVELLDRTRDGRAVRVWLAEQGSFEQARTNTNKPIPPDY